ncbi:hypothetical protein [Defluviimonas sp. SAOS-178_SWC]|uniref:hypothetical protein n=1 Tax=Defluviimonas sp. SAOS-178_SWC TaxID=3121287 RepID=UPI0032220BA7
MRTVGDITNFLRREFPEIVKSGNVLGLFKHLPDAKSLLVESPNGPPIKLPDSAIGHFSFKPQPDVIVSSKALAAIESALNNRPEAEPVKAVAFGDLATEATDTLSHPRLRFKRNADGTRVHTPTGTIISGPQYDSLVALFESAEKRRKERGTIEDELEFQLFKNRKTFAELFEKQTDGSYLFRPWAGDVTAIIPYQKWGKLRKEYEAHPMRDDDKKTAHLRWLASQQDDAA